ncbi:hypothetical protein RIR_jg37029.t2 [Rhizophagus irregularis DAOM 181602=DAOM 197198]|nr:hypothetical protein RIR_jg37029.t2 [Rhizophagus irregularis DAOM 181602=DAOM 197198]
MKIEYARTLQLPNRLFHLRINSTFMRHHEYASISFNDEYPYASTISRPKLSLFSIHRRTGSTTTKRFLEGNERTEKRVRIVMMMISKNILFLYRMKDRPVMKRIPI